MRKMFVFRCHALSHNLSFQIHTNTKNLALMEMLHTKRDN